MRRADQCRAEVERAFYAGWDGWDYDAPRDMTDKWRKRCRETYRYGREAGLTRDEIRATKGGPMPVRVEVE